MRGNDVRGMRLPLSGRREPGLIAEAFRTKDYVSKPCVLGTAGIAVADARIQQFAGPLAASVSAQPAVPPLRQRLI